MVESQKIYSYILRQDFGLASWEYMAKPIFEIMPKDFLNFAKSDLKLKNKRSSVNALSNAKRAIDSQIDSILYILGYYDKSRKEKWNFPKKIDFLNYLGIASPNVLKKINKSRNLLEHEYKYPHKEKVDDIIDIVDLFLRATEKIVNRIVHFFTFEISMYSKLSREGTNRYSQIELTYSSKNRHFQMGLVGSNQKFFVEEDSPEFSPLLKKYVGFIIEA